ncbi:MAG TPA: hypothetical protein G4O01_07000 [Dehalococcoidia bacterium]|jgi:phosphatidylglycerophosphate synthase|nr:hypothetical protein [Dehalococcoidia bacterium]
MIEELRAACDKHESESLIIRLLRIFSVYLTALFVKLDLHPNSVSLLSIIAAITGGILLTLGTQRYFIVGAVVLLFSHLLDRCDGELARYTGKFTAYGSYLEVLNSNILYSSIFIGLSVGTYRLLGDINMLWFGISAMLFKLLYRFSETRRGTLLKNLKQSSRYAPLTLNQASSIYKRVLWEAFMFLFFAGGILLLILLFAILNQLDILVMFYGVTMPLLFLVQNYFHWLDLRGR